MSESDGDAWLDDLFTQDLCTRMRSIMESAHGGPAYVAFRESFYGTRRLTDGITGMTVCEGLARLGVRSASRVVAGGKYWDDRFLPDTPGISARLLLARAIQDHNCHSRTDSDVLAALVVAGGVISSSPCTHLRLYHGTTYGAAAAWIEGAASASPFFTSDCADFGGGVYMYDDEEFAVHQARATSLATVGVHMEAVASRPVLVVADVDMDALRRECALEAFDGGAWAQLVSACVQGTLVHLEEDHTDVHRRYMDADVVHGKVCRNTQDVDCQSVPVEYSVTQTVFRTCESVRALLRLGMLRVCVL